MLGQLEKPRLHYSWVIAGVTFLILLITAGVRATPAILMVPLEEEFKWTSSAISAAIAVNIALFGIIGPFAASLMNRYGLRRLVLLALAVLASAMALASRVTSKWEFTLLWGIVVGSGTGFTSGVLATVVVNRWFEERRGIVLGFLSAANATGQLVFLPMLARVTSRHGWRTSTSLVAAVGASVFLIALCCLKDHPSDVGLAPYGATPRISDTSRSLSSLPALFTAARSREFWILAGSFFVCGASTNGLVGTHLIPACVDHGIPEVAAASLLALMGVFDLIGTTVSGWLTDRINSAVLLFWYYLLRGTSLMILPYALASRSVGLSLFAIFYGLDWIATVPPTVRMTTDKWGKHNSGVLYGWLYAAHQMGASLAAFIAGSIRTHLGDYRDAFWLSGLLCLLAAAGLILTRTKRSITSHDPCTPKSQI